MEIQILRGGMGEGVGGGFARPCVFSGGVRHEFSILKMKLQSSQTRSQPHPQ